MELNAFGLVAFVLCLFVAFSNVRHALMLTIALIPFGAASVVNLSGGMSLPVAEVSAGLTVCALLLQRALAGNLSDLLRIDRFHWSLLLFAVYSVFSATVLVRIFQNDIFVFSLDRSATDGDRVSGAFGSMVSPLVPSSGNISQTFYLCLSVLFFFFCVQLWRSASLAFAHRCLIVCATVNLVLGAIDLAGIDSVMQHLRTANYRIHDSHQIGGIPRVIGGFSEPSRFGAFTAVMLAYFGSHYIATRRTSSFVLATLSFSFAALSLSSTAFLGIALTMVAVLGVAYRNVLRRSIVGLVVVGALAVALFTALVIVIGGLDRFDTVSEVLDTLLFGKATSVSALERGAWAQGGYEAFLASWGLGIGVGSFRGSGWASVFLGSVGIPGTLLILYFITTVLRGRVDATVAPALRVRTPRPRAHGERAQNAELDLRASRMANRSRVVAHAGTVAIFAAVAMALASQTTADPGLMTMFLLAMVYSAHREVVGLRMHGLSEAPRRVRVRPTEAIA